MWRGHMWRRVSHRARRLRLWRREVGVLREWWSSTRYHSRRSNGHLWWRWPIDHGHRKRWTERWRCRKNRGSLYLHLACRRRHRPGHLRWTGYIQRKTWRRWQWSHRRRCKLWWSHWTRQRIAYHARLLIPTHCLCHSLVRCPAYAPGMPIPYHLLWLFLLLFDLRFHCIRNFLFGRAEDIRSCSSQSHYIT